MKSETKCERKFRRIWLKGKTKRKRVKARDNRCK